MRQQSHVSRSTTHSLNLIALLGWMYGFTLFLFVSSYEGLIEFGIPLTLALESICILEGTLKDVFDIYIRIIFLALV